MGRFISDDERDDFWDLSALTPKRKNPVPTFSKRVELSEITVSEEPSDETKKSEQAKGESSFSFQSVKRNEKGQKICSSYEPSDNKFIKKVVISEESQGYNFYGSFKKDAERYYNETGEKSGFVPYFSSVPQYSQLNEEQKNYYFFWRDCIRRGEYIKCDYSYFWLYIYEVVNLSSQISPKEGVKLLCSVWREYRKQLPAIDKNMTAWVCDYCLIHGLSCPLEEISSFVAEIIEFMPLKEFYLASSSSFDEIDADYIMGVASDYNWHMSKLLNSEKYADMFLTHMNASLKEPFRLLFENGETSLDTDEVRSIRYSAFSRSLCGYFTRKSIYVEYYSLSSSEKIRNTVTQTVKYAENRLRAFLSVKSRLSAHTLREDYKKAIDEYYDKLVCKREKENELKTRPAYEKLYDAEERSLSFSYAESIERSSWDIARRLAPEDELSEDFSPVKEEIFVDEASTAFENVAENEQKSAENESKDNSYGLSSSHIEFIRALSENDFARASEIARRAGETPEGFSDKINESFSDFFGDVIIEITECGCAIISDYETEVAEWLKEN
ncbi:MAG: hypothetical protein E7587_02765 [Ruminococcaceae bacterium]|nr:hypothetical protein [Oscillospiraceae bacterium]